MGFTLPRFRVGLAPPDLDPWRRGNAGLPGWWTFEGAAPGPHVALVALTHGNELAGAIALDRLLLAGLRPDAGRLSLCFANIAAMDRFDPADPTASRYVEEDLNRVWSPRTLARRDSAEIRRARELLPALETVDVLLDLHSMLWPGDPLLLGGPAAAGRHLGLRMGDPGLLVTDQGHPGGRRLIDHPRFSGARCGLLLEAGQHWAAETVVQTLASIGRLLRVTGTVARHPALPPHRPAAAGRAAVVTRTVVAATHRFRFLREFRNGETIARAGTVLAMDGDAPVVTPHDDCLLVLPSLRPGQGHMAVRLARFEPVSAGPA